MAARIGINGFDGNARMILRLLKGENGLEVTHINDTMPPEQMSRLLTHDALRGGFPFSIDYDENHLIVNGKNILVTHFETAEEIPWDAEGVEFVLENHEKFQTHDQLRGHLHSGVRNVILSYLPDNLALCRTIAMGINHFDFQPNDGILSVATGEVNCGAILLKVLHDEFGVARSFMNAVRPAKDSQLIPPTSDAFSQGMSVTIADAVRAIPAIMPEMRGLFDGCATSVPVVGGSYVELTAELYHGTTAHDVREAFRRHAAGPLSGILDFSRDSIAGRDALGKPHSALFDAPATKIIGENLVQILGWFDETASTSNRIIDIIKYIQSYE